MFIREAEKEHCTYVDKLAIGALAPYTKLLLVSEVILVSGRPFNLKELGSCKGSVLSKTSNEQKFISKENLQIGKKHKRYPSPFSVVVVFWICRRRYCPEERSTLRLNSQVAGTEIDSHGIVSFWRAL